MKLIIPIEPKAQARPRIRAFKSKYGKIIGMAYKSTPQRQSENTLITYLLNKVEKQGIKKIEADIAVLLGVKCYLSIPKSWSMKKRVQACDGEIRPTTKPDL